MKKIILIFIILQLYFLSTNAGVSPKRQMFLANSEFKDENYKKALPLYLSIYDLDSTNSELNMKIAICYIKGLFKHKALPYLQAAYKSDPNINHINFLLAEAYQFSHQFESALKFYKKDLVDIDNIKSTEEREYLTAITKRKIYECENGIIALKNPVKAIIKNIGNTINSKFPDYAPVITADKSILVFTSRREGELNEKGEFKEDLYISYFKDGEWSTPKNLGKPVNSDENDASIALSPDGNQVFIYKDENGGDIYTSKLKGNVWSNPKPLSNKINTKNYEPSVSMSSDGNYLYFSSNKEGGLGGLDIYVSKKNLKGEWGIATNLGPTINTMYDDDAPFVHPDGVTLYFSSKGHNGIGGYDIYKATKTNADVETYGKPENLGYPINTADDDIYFVLTADNKQGFYASAKDGGEGDVDIYTIDMPKAENLIEIAASETVVIETNIDSPERRIVAPVAIIKTSNPITMLKGVITDEKTKEPLEAKIIVVDNTKNEIISELESNSTTGSFLIVLQSGRNYGIRVEKEKYLFHSENFDIPKSNDYQEINKDVALNKIEIGKRIVLRNIFFDTDKSTLRPQSEAELARLKLLLNDNPKIKIEISGHTDNKGSADHNKKLSENRAKAVVDYLIKNGISKDRLTFAGYGFEKPMWNNETEYGRQMNRRTEFEIKAD